MKKFFFIFVLLILFNCRQTKDLAIIVVDVQACFTELKSGSLAVKNTGEDFIDRVNKKTAEFKKAGIPVFATQDWHPEKHVSFFTSHPDKKPFDKISVNGREQVLWPEHCVQNTEGADILLPPELFTSVVKKGADINYDSYSGFMDDGGKKTPMEETLKKAGVKKLIVYGIATDYCVQATAVDAKQAGFEVTVLTDLSRGVDPATTEQAIKNMQEKGIKILESASLPDPGKL